MKINWAYHCKAGVYRSNTLRGLVWEILTHRWWHFKRGDGWVD